MIYVTLATDSQKLSKLKYTVAGTIFKTLVTLIKKTLLESKIEYITNNFI